jgi:hypothetical protein
MNASVQSAINQASATTGVPAAILTAVANQESGGNPNAIGKAGEVGAFQLMPATAASLGVDPYDVNENAAGAAMYLDQLYSQYGSWDLALAAYNSGPGTVSNAVSNYGSNWVSGVPASTQNYVNNILASAGIVGTSSAPGGISTPLATAPASSDEQGVYVDTSTDASGGVSGFLTSLSTPEIIGLGAAALLLVWYLV